jgi:hypothetical protein
MRINIMHNTYITLNKQNWLEVIIKVNDLPVYDVVNAYLEHSIDLVFLMNNSAENAMKMIEEHILKSSYSEDKNIH